MGTGGAAPTSLKDRLSLALEGAGRASTLDPNSDSGTEAFVGSALKSFATVQGFRRQMSANQEAQQDKALEHKSQQDLREAQSEYYRSRAKAGPTGQTQENRIELENLRHGHLLERIRTAADLRRRQIATKKEGQVTPAERAVLGRTERADVSGSRAVENERAQATRGYRDPLAPGEENDIMARIRRQTDPNYVSDSTAVADVINPKLGVPRPPAPAPREDPLAPGSRTRSILENYLRGRNAVVQGGPSTSRQSVAPQASPAPVVPDSEPEDQGADVAPDDTTDETPVDETQADQGDTLDADEIDAAVSMIEDLEGPDAERELADAGYNDAQVQTILAHRTSGKPQ